MARETTPLDASPVPGRAGWDVLPHAYAEIEDDRIVLVNSGWSDLLGRSVGELEGVALYDLVHPDDIPVLAAAAALPESEPLRTIVGLRHADAGYVRVLWSARRRGRRWHVTAIDLESVRSLEPRKAGALLLPDAERLLGFGTFETDMRTGELRGSAQLALMAGGLPGTTGEAESRLLPDERERVRGAVAGVLIDRQPDRIEFQWNARGALTPAEAWLFPRLEAGTTVGLGGIVRDLSSGHLGAQRLERQVRLLDAVDAGVVGLDLDGAVIDWNTAAQRLYGWADREVVGRSMEELVPEVGRARSPAAVAGSLRQRGFWEGDVELMREDGTRVPVLLREALVPGPDGLPAGRASIAVDLSARVRIEERLDAARSFSSTVTEKMADGMCTVDRGGRLTYMNEAAERLLGWSFAELRGHLMHEVTHYRHADGRPYPASECPIVAGRRDGRELGVAEDVFIRRDGTAMPVEYTCSPFVTDEGDASSVIVFRDITERSLRDVRLRGEVESLSWAERVRAAMAEDRLEIYGQSIVSVGGDVLATELLVRMRDEQGVMVEPREFWSAAERHGLFPGLDAAVVATAGRLAGAGTSVAVNVAAPTIGDSRYAEALRSAAEAARDVPLTLEVSERAVVADEAAARAFFEHARDLGCRIAVDQFGTGATGFEYLQALPVDLLKLDRELMRDLVSNRGSRHVVAAVVTLAQTLGLQTVAVGVESEEALSLVRALGVDFVQGLLLGAPQPIESWHTGGQDD